MSKDLHQRDAAQARGSKLLLAMGIIVLLYTTQNSACQHYFLIFSA